MAESVSTAQNKPELSTGQQDDSSMTSPVEALGNASESPKPDADCPKPADVSGSATVPDQIEEIQNPGSEAENLETEAEPFPLRAISLQYILKLLDEGQIEPSWTAQTVKEQFVIPQTTSSKTSFAAIASDKDAADANVFVSHAWAYKFSDLVSALKAWAAKNNRPADQLYLWLDLFSVNQHTSANVTQEWWSTVFKEGIRRTGEVQ